MGYSNSFMITLSVSERSTILLLIVVLNIVANGHPLVPALFIFGDSFVDVGNNNQLLTVIKANFPPYGRDFENHNPTGRFSNGKLAIDFIAETIGFTSSPPAYLNLDIKGNSLLNGANFASAGSGLLDHTGRQHNIYALGARKIGLSTIPPMGCLPVAITAVGLHSNECVPWLNYAALNFNQKLNTISQDFKQMLPGINLVILDMYQPLYDMVTKPSDYGFFEARKGCCGTGLVETSIMCNQMSIGTCANASQYVFWDGMHPTEATNKILADHLVAAGTSLISKSNLSVHIVDLLDLNLFPFYPNQTFISSHCGNTRLECVCYWSDTLKCT
ncbi:GDSL esterase/lipase At5g22810-like [Lotus japonicus]|uniref:GDSL esterase/lipase At5g22810-like n=1 Tax=Lotus japonicus TaxID=34305 RepID=UPI00258ABE30|nr:GDSL esterase/lipase At5g22810-like [Lotus japonicus]